MIDRLFIVLVLVASVSISAFGQGFSAAQFREFTTMRTGTGQPVYWYCVGEVYEYPSGKLIAKVEGVDTARYIAAESTPTKALQLSRKIFFYRDPVTNALMREFAGKKVEPIAYPYQQITYEYKDGNMVSSVIQGKAPRIQNISQTSENRVRSFGGVTVYSAPLFLNFGTFQAYENYDFFVQKTGKPKYQLSWNRRGALQPFFGGGDSVFQLASYRIDRYADLPKTMREALESDGRLWMAPPKDLSEIKELQK